MDQQSSIFAQLLPLVVLFILMYFIVIRPQKKQQQEHQKLVESLAKGDRVVTLSGMHGLVTDVDKDTVVLRLEDNVRVRYDKSAVSHKLKSE